MIYRSGYLLNFVLFTSEPDVKGTQWEADSLDNTGEKYGVPCENRTN